MTRVLLAILLAAAPAGDIAVRFSDVTEKAGIRFVHNNGAFGGKYLPETMGSGCAFFAAPDGQCHAMVTFWADKYRFKSMTCYEVAAFPKGSPALHVLACHCGVLASGGLRFRERETHVWR